jgi:putative peptidoglycan lipid II flippase
MSAQTVALPRGDTLARAALVTVAITMAGSLLGFVRDLLLARYFGATGGTDAFLVAWTVPETAFPLVVEGVMSLLMVPLFSRALSAGGSLYTMDDVVRATLPRILALLAAAAAAVAAGAPWLVRLIAPGLAHPELAVACTRWTAVTVLAFGLAGYLSAALRAHHVFAAPATIHLAYNAGILALIVTLSARYGVLAAAAGVAVGSLLMVAAQLPAYLRRVGLPRLRAAAADQARAARLLTFGAFAPIAVYTLSRQAQVFVERFLGSSLPPGTISHLNYAQKVAQVPVLAALLICTVTFPTLARDVAAGQVAVAARRLASDLRAVTALVLACAAGLVALAPVVVRILLQHGEFGAADTAATASVLRIYALGLLGQALVGVLCRPYFAAGPGTRGPGTRGPGTRGPGVGGQPGARGQAGWYPAVAMGAGLAVTVAVAFTATPVFGAPGIAAGNAAGITVAAALLLTGLRRRGVPLPLSTVAGGIGWLVVSAIGAGLAGWLVSRLVAGPSLVVGVAGGATVLATFTILARWRWHRAG